MTNQQIKQAILGIVEELYQRKYIGSLKVERINSAIKTSFGLSNDYKPIVIIADMNEEDYLKFIRKELRSRRLHFTEYYAIKKEHPLECPTDRKCKSCNENL